MLMHRKHLGDVLTVPRLTSILLRRGIGQTIAEHDINKIHTLLAILQSSPNEFQSKENISLISQLSQKYDLWGIMEQHASSQDTETLIQNLPPGLVLKNTLNFLKHNNYKSGIKNDKHLIARLKELASKKSIEVLIGSQIDGIEEKNVILTLLIFHLSIAYNMNKIALEIVQDISKLLVSDKSEINIHVFLKVINPTNVDTLVNSLLLDSSDTYLNINDIFNITSTTAKTTIILNHKHHLSLPVFSLSKSQVSKVLMLAANEKPTKHAEQDSLYAEIRVKIINEVGYYIASLPSDGKSLYSIAKYKSLLQEYLSYCYEYIRDRIQRGDLAAVYSTWIIISPFHDKLHNSDLTSPNNSELNNFAFYELLGSIITVFNKEKRYLNLVQEIIKELPIEAIKVAPNLMSALLSYSATVEDYELSDLLLNQYDDSTLGLRTRYSPQQLSALLKLTLKQGNFQKSQEVLTFARENMIQFGAHEFRDLVLATLKNDPTGEHAWNLITESTPKEAKLGYLAYLQHFLRKGIVDYRKIDLVFQIARKSFQETEAFWQYFISIYFNYISRKYPLQVAMSIYENSVNFKKEEKVFKTLEDYNFTSNPFLTRYNKVIFKRIMLSTKSLIIRDVYLLSFKCFRKSFGSGDSDRAKAKEQLEQVSIWAIKNFRKLGYTDISISVDLTKAINKESRKLGLKEYEGVKHGKGTTSLEAEFLESYRGYEKEWTKRSVFHRDPSSV